MFGRAIITRSPSFASASLTAVYSIALRMPASASAARAPESSTSARGVMVIEEPGGGRRGLRRNARQSCVVRTRRAVRIALDLGGLLAQLPIEPSRTGAVARVAAAAP
jgi:hypothetical protein